MEIEAKARLSWMTLIVEKKPARSFFLFKQTLHDTERDWISARSPHSPCINAACKWQENYNPPLNVPLWALCSTPTVLQLHIVQLMRLRTGCRWNNIIYSERTDFTNVKIECRFDGLLPGTLTFPFGQRHQVDIYTHFAIRSNEVHFGLWEQPPIFSLPDHSTYPNKETASLLAVRNFLTERSHRLSWHRRDLDISGNQTCETLEFIFI